VTLVGKILTLAITILSILFLAFAIVVYTAKENWRDKYQEASAELSKTRQELEAVKKQREELAMLFDEARKKAADQLNQLREENRIQQENMTRLLEAYQELRRELETAQQRAATALQEVDARRQEVDLLRSQLERVLEDKDRAVRQAFEAEQKLIEVRSQLEVAQERNQQLQERIAELRGILAQHGLPTEARDIAALKAPPRVEGVVLEVDRANRYVRISIGSDDGLVVGHRLHVFRERNNGKYLGQIEITDVEPDRAVARVLSDVKQGRIEVGDHVATYLTGTGQ